MLVIQKQQNLKIDLSWRPRCKVSLPNIHMLFPLLARQDHRNGISFFIQVRKNTIQLFQKPRKQQKFQRQLKRLIQTFFTP